MPGGATAVRNIEVQSSVVCGLCEDILPTIASESVQLVFTSPPYGVGMEYEPDLRIGMLFRKLNFVMMQTARVLCRGGYAVFNFGNIISAREIIGTEEPCEMPMGWIYWAFGLSSGMVLQAQRIWKKSFAKITGGKHAISAPRPVPEFEHLFTFRKVDGEPKEQKIRNRQISQYAVWDTSNEKPTGSKHPAAFPEGLVSRVIEIYTDPGDIVLDPFAGGGTVAVVAKRMDRRFIVIEKEPGYCDEIKRRLAEGSVT
jgi:DNA modification methylase